MRWVELVYSCPANGACAPEAGRAWGNPEGTIPFCFRFGKGITRSVHLGALPNLAWREDIPPARTSGGKDILFSLEYE